MRWSDTCDKYVYDSKRQAKKYWNLRTGKKLRVYYCNACKGFHVTKQVKRR